MQILAGHNGFMGSEVKQFACGPPARKGKRLDLDLVLPDC